MRSRLGCELQRLGVCHLMGISCKQTVVSVREKVTGGMREVTGGQFALLSKAKADDKV